MSLIKSQKTLMIILILCVGQFLFCLITVQSNPHANSKLLLGLSAIFGILVSGMARRSYSDHRVNQTSQPLSEEEFKQHFQTKPDHEQKD